MQPVAQLGTRGVTVLLATGDFGVGEGDCKDDSGKVQFLPMFPATCTCGVSSLLCKQHTSAGTIRSPRIRRSYVTSVGGTMNHDPEVAAIFSGGGFSSHFPRPPFQDRAVPTFLENLGSKYTGLYKYVRRGMT